MDPIKRISHDLNRMANTTKSTGREDGGFVETLQSFYHQVNRGLIEADQEVRAFALGKGHDLHDVMIAGEKANLSFRFLLKIRNKLLEAYQEIMRMQF